MVCLARESVNSPQYDVENGQQAGGGGEYEVQVGFGWTNGVVLDLLRRYGSRLAFNASVHTWLEQPTSLAPRLAAPRCALVLILMLVVARLR